MAVTNSYNFEWYRISKQEKLRRIVDILDKYPEGAQPKTISRKTGLNHNTVRAYLIALRSSGHVKMLSNGFYLVTKTSHGVGVGVEKLPKIHNINLSYDASSLSYKHTEKTVTVDDVKIRAVFGVKNKKITGSISAEPPLNYREFKFAVNEFKYLVRSVIGFCPFDDSILVTSCELNQDYGDLRIDGCNSLTIKTVLGDLEKIYNKRNCLRSEIRVKSLPLQSVYALLKGGIISYNIIERQTSIEEKVDEQIKAIKYLNGYTFQNSLLMKAILDKLNNGLDREIVRKEVGTYGLL